MPNVASTVRIDFRHIPEIADFVRWTTAPIDLIDTTGEQYLSMGSILGIGKVTVENSIKSSPLQLTLTGLDPSILELMSKVNIQRVPVLIQRVFFEDGSNDVTTKEEYYRGHGEAPEQNVNYQGQTQYVTLTMDCYSVFDMNAKQSLARMNNQTHQFYHEGDLFMKYAAVDINTNNDEMWKQ
ncbi:hypothetical protein [Aeromonas hydrophila]